MAITGDSTDPRCTKRSNKGLILESLYIHKLLKVAKCLFKICLPSNIYSDDIYDIFSLFSNDEVLTLIIKNIKVYGSWYCESLKAACKMY